MKVAETVVNVISAMILIAVIGLLFARVGNDWFANQTTLPDTRRNLLSQTPEARYVTSLGYPCPCCGWKIAFIPKGDWAWAGIPNAHHASTPSNLPSQLKDDRTGC